MDPGLICNLLSSGLIYHFVLSSGLIYKRLETFPWIFRIH